MCLCECLKRSVGGDPTGFLSFFLSFFFVCVCVLNRFWNEEDTNGHVHEGTRWLAFVAWWFGLGVLSSIGQLLLCFSLFSIAFHVVGLGEK